MLNYLLVKTVLMQPVQQMMPTQSLQNISVFNAPDGDLAGVGYGPGVEAPDRDPSAQSFARA